MRPPRDVRVSNRPNPYWLTRRGPERRAPVSTRPDAEADQHPARTKRLPLVVAPQDDTALFAGP